MHVVMRITSKHGDDDSRQGEADSETVLALVGLLM
jgi:hypothetical protein